MTLREIELRTIWETPAGTKYGNCIVPNKEMLADPKFWENLAEQIRRQT